MPISGTLDVVPHLDAAPRMPDLNTDALELQNTEILHIQFEIADAEIDTLIPPALHPTIPPVVQITVLKAPESPAGPFTFAQVRVGCRAGVRPRGYTTGVFCDNEQAAKLLADRWGFPCRPADVHLQRFYDRVRATVILDGLPILDAELEDPLPISGFDVQYTASVNLVRVERDGVEVPRLVQVDPDYTIRRADRGHPLLNAFDAEAWDAAGVDPVYPVSASYTVADVVLPQLRYLMDPAKSAFQGTETV